ncbi:MAG: hypothetical protein A2Y10_17250 [Planctomycetes bacterium GWF2_41_51]|nr:MAG: hypothetical protein A2Y10_17250 [Planctomycetes bacterium GWF2_41_51]HBG27876.1 hypothetical protein [Phycisphaerales bacterium]
MKSKGFTLVELLVVISIIAILLAVLMPSLQKAREQGKTIICSNGQKQLGTAWYTYAVSNDGKILCSLTYKTFDEGDIRADHTRYSWVWAPYDVVTKKTTKDKVIPTLAQEQEGIKRGKLYSYAADFDLFHCPSVKYEEHKGHFRSFSIPDCMNGEQTFIPNSPSAKLYENYTNMAQIKRPAEKFVIVEENDDSRAYNMDSWKPVFTDTTMDGDPLAIRHSNTTRSCFSFADGHSEQKRWSSEFIRHFQYYEKTKTVYGFQTFRVSSEEGKKDLMWLKQGWPWKNK